VMLLRFVRNGEFDRMQALLKFVSDPCGEGHS
jgi:hypothetical protein